MGKAKTKIEERDKSDKKKEDKEHFEGQIKQRAKLLKFIYEICDRLRLRFENET